MDAATLHDLLEPVIGKPGSLSVLVRRVGQVAFPTEGNRKLTGVEVRPDGLVRLERADGWVIIEPAEVAAVAWHGEPDSDRPGQFL